MVSPQISRLSSLPKTFLLFLFFCFFDFSLQFSYLKPQRNNYAFSDVLPSSRTRSSLTIVTGSSFEGLIDVMIQASELDLPNVVAKEVKQVASPAFFLALADKVDKAPTEEEKESLIALSSEVTRILEELLKVAETRMDKASKTAEAIVVSAAEKDGQFLVPLSAERKQGMKLMIDRFQEDLDDNFLNTVSAWMKKAQEDKMEGMVQILQKVLQLYAAQVLRLKPASKTSSLPESYKFFDDLLESDPELWPALLRKGLFEEKRCTSEALLGAVQVTIESVVMQQENGSLAQRVQAEFLGELIALLKNIEIDSAKESQ